MKATDQLQIAAPMDGAAMIEIISRAAQDPAIDVDKMERLLGMAERMEERQAARSFASAFVALQSDMPGISPTRAVPGNDGGVRYRFAPYEEIMRSVKPLLAKHGFTVTFDTRVAEGRITSVCTLMHAGGHSRSNEFSCRIGSGPPKASEAQADGSAQTYSKRFALCNALNIVVEHDDDARTVGATIDPELAAQIQRRLVATRGDESKFLAWVGAKTFEEIGEAKLPEIETMLARRERKMEAEG